VQGTPDGELQWRGDSDDGPCDDDVLGSGGEGIVFRAMWHRDEAAALPVAVKRIPANRVHTDELQLLRQLGHPNVVRSVEMFQLACLSKSLSVLQSVLQSASQSARL
jgi:hypothetical protein